MTFERVMRYDPTLRMLRVCRWSWSRGEFGEGGYAARLSLGLRPALFSFHRGEDHGWRLTFLGVRLHYSRAYGASFDT